MFDYEVPDNPKMVHEAMCLAQNLIVLYRLDGEHYARILNNFIHECERKRPLGPDGKHGTRHTSECGCEDKSDFHCLECRQPIGRRHLTECRELGLVRLN